ncbi:uncharacterized protein [Haliotis asinina]|uniref:uncharacterized protein n=1 Tax=Haliotis asinina TaxID=109174 RepID=UPI003532779E
MTGFGIFGVAILTGLIQLSSGSCTEGMFGDSCRYFCHCRTSCNVTTGACSGPCNSGWIKGGSMCQKQNIALNKSASITSGSATTWSPQKAVDGNSDIDGENTTCFVAGGSPSDWTVDLGRDFQLYDIRIYSRRNYYWRNANSTIYLNNDNGTICYTFPSKPATANKTDVTCNGTSRYVTIRNPGIESGFNDSLNICEVEIYVCSQNLYGENCDMFCHCLNSTCDRWTGVCPGDCRPGWQGTRCDTECDSNHYGSNCRGVCSSRHCVGNSSCDSKGTCLSGWNTMADRAAKPALNKSVTPLLIPYPDYKVVIRSYIRDIMQKRWDTQNVIPSIMDQTVVAYAPPDTVLEPLHVKQEEPVRMDVTRDGHDQTAQFLCLCTFFASSSGTDNTLLQLIVVSTVAGVLLVIVLVLVVILIRRRAKRNVIARDKSGTDKSVKGKFSKANESSEYVNLSFEKEETADEPFRQNPEEKTLEGIQSRSKRDSYATVVKKSARGGSRNLGLTQAVPKKTDEEDHNAVLPVQVEDRPDVPDRNYYNTADAGRDQVFSLSEPQTTDEQMKSAEEEFYRLPQSFVHSYDESQHPRNKGKNRFKGYYPYDYNRVVLHDDSEGTRGDYINASYIDGYKAGKRYIAAQGPYRQEVMVDFWRMVYQEQCATVVMLTEILEAGKMKCLQYWPKQGSLQFGDITVTMETETRLANYNITQMSLQKEKEDKILHLNHFQFTGWPDNDVPDTSSLLEFMWRVKGTSGGLEHPIVIHCSAGAGRTGTYIAIESLVDQAEAEGKTDVVSFVTNMRGQRKSVIQNKEQYLFLYQAVAMAVSEGDTSLDADIIKQTDLRRMSEITMGNKNVQQHLEALENEREEGFQRDPVTTVSSHKSKNGFVVFSSQDKEELWNQVHENDSRILITWAADKPLYLPSNDSPITTSRIEASMRDSTLISDNVVLNTVELTAEGADDSTLIQHYHLTGSTRDQNVTLLIDSILTRLNDQQQCCCTVVSHSESEARLLILLVNIASRLEDDGKVDVIRNMRRLQSSLGGPPFTEEDVCLCLEFAQRRLDSSIYVNA